MEFKPDWPQVKDHFRKFWKREGLIVHMNAPRREPLEGFPEPAKPDDPALWYMDPQIAWAKMLNYMATHFYGGDAFPHFVPYFGPGSLGTFLGSEPQFSLSTVWYEPCIEDPDTYGPIVFREDNVWWQRHLAVLDEGIRRNEGRYVCGMPDLIENIDTLAELRDNQLLLMDPIERPNWVMRSIDEINQAFFTAFDLLYEKIKDDEGGNTFMFEIWGPGKTAKVQCDFSCMISPEMFARFVVPALTEQCRWLDYSLYHLDGTNALQHLDAVLAIEPLDVVEWTPQAGKPRGGDAVWYDMYRKIKAAGKCVQAVGVRAEDVIPLIEVVGPEGLYLMATAPDQDTAERVLEQVEQYR